MFNKRCETCRIRDPRQNVCRITGSVVEPQKDFCSKHADKIETCESCGRLVMKPYLVPDGCTYHLFCEDCATQLNTCNFCKKATTCEFETNPSSLPKMVQKQIRQGNMTTVMTVKNPARIDITCRVNCSCFSEDFECMRQFHYCERMDHIYGNPDNGNESQ